MTERMTTKQLAAALAAKRDNDVAVHLGPNYVPVTGLRYESLLDTHVLNLDPEAVEDGVLAHPTVTLLDAALHSVWLHGDWFWVTRSMTTEEKEAAAAAVLRHYATVDDGLEHDDRVLRWWAPEHRYNAHGADMHRITVGAEIEVERPAAGRFTGVVHRRFARSVLIARAPGSSATYGVMFDDILRVISSPVDDVLTRMDGEGR